MLGSKQWFGSASPAVQREDVLKYLPALMPRPALTDREILHHQPVSILTGGDVHSEKADETSLLPKKEEKATRVRADAFAKRLTKIRALEAHRGPVAWDTEFWNVELTRNTPAHSSGELLCLTAFGGGKLDFGSGPLLFVDCKGPSRHVLDLFRSYFENPAKRKIFHNFAADAHVLYGHGITVRGLEADTRYLARLFDSSLSSWEDQVRVSNDLLVCLASRRKNHRRQREVVGVSDGESENCLYRFAGRLGIGGLEAHCSEEKFGEWLKYAADDAYFTFMLYRRLTDTLRGQEWCTELHWQPIREKIRHGTTTFNGMNDPETYTGLSMSDFAVKFYRPFTELLVEIERRGFGANREYLIQQLTAAQADLERHKEAFRMIAQSLKDRRGQPLNPQAEFINPRSAKQIRQLLFGNPDEPDHLRWVARRVRAGEEAEWIQPFMEFPTAPSSKHRFIVKGLGLQPIAYLYGRERLSNYAPSGWPKVESAILRAFAGEPHEGNYGVAYQQLEPVRGHEHAASVCRLLWHLQRSIRISAAITSVLSPLIERIKYDEDGFGRIHPSLALDTTTGRLCCRKPNLQNPPSAHNDLYSIRKAFSARPGNTLIVGDYSQLELRILAHMSRCESMIRQLNQGGDIHSQCAVDLFPEVAEAVANGSVGRLHSRIDRRATVQVVIDDAEAHPGIPSVKTKFSTQRQQAKVMNFSIAYGKTERTLAEEMDLPVTDIRDMFTRWNNSKKGVERWKAEILREVRACSGEFRHPRVGGRHRHDGHASRRSRRETTAHGVKIVMQVHDEVILEGPAENATDAVPIVRDLMEHPFADIKPDYRMLINLDVDIATGTNWSDAKP
ncbi:dna polymerase i, putative [Perkinsus marinus ATCC 50983]|uniref:Dna polymerase i, putative n=1 Tax=Perkinsus marinus (strain ATCC 50983 / TXsc) TaxID=423536 RepID=C5LBC1_PERM5|nr:dna polymerase i, putative [Perkinsus marinus ATCC 50983]EER06049.1 dna polymerase i, putative [Perkinsus marinus ATCC 50983]|eukprot:XP_002774233.1 dna polymerase i, putative [Perkinsus marinus ATCC 50983]